MVLAAPLVPPSVKLLPAPLVILTISIFVNVTGARVPAVIVWPEMVTGRPSALKFSVLAPLLSLPPSTEIGVVAEGVMVNVSLPVAFGSTPIEADWARSVPATVTVAPLGSSLPLAVIAIVETASIVEPDSMTTLSPAKSVTDEPVDWTITPEFTVRSSPGVFAGQSVCAVRLMAATAVIFALWVSGLWASMFTGPVPVAVEVIGWDGAAKTTFAIAIA